MWRSEWNRAVVGATLIFAAWSGNVAAQTCGLPAWNHFPPGSGSPMAAAVFGHAASTDGSLIYSACGSITFPTGQALDIFQSYNPLTDAWTNLVAVPIPVGGANLYYVGGQFFLFGGVDNSGVVRDLLQIYTVTTNTWTISSASMPGPRFAMGGGVVNGLIYLVGGSSTFNPNSPQSQTWEFNPVTSTYTIRTSLPAVNYRPGSAVSGGRLYVISGEGSGGALVNTNYEYTPPPADVWATRAPIPTAVNKPGATTLGAVDQCNGDIMIVSGGTPFLPSESSQQRVPQSTGITQIYDVATNMWSSGPTLPSGRFSLQALQAGNTLIAFGGYDGSTTVATVDRIQGLPLPVEAQSFSVED